MRLVLLLLIVFFSTTLSFGSHVVGGQFEIIHLSEFTYRIKLILYYDVINAQAPRPPILPVGIFGRSDDKLLMDVDLDLFEIIRVPYLQPECATGEVETDALIYVRDLELSPEQFGDQAGYYISEQICCRNYNISNIFSDPGNPTTVGNGILAGITFYMEFPAVVDENGDQYINSSPIDFPALNAYGCPYRPYFVDFTGTDPDGDSLVYSLTTPLSMQFDPNAGPGIRSYPRPYPLITWIPGFSIDKVTGGFPELKISPSGFLTVTPQQLGLYVFSVRVEEYRDTVKIGEVIRDFQFFVVDGCELTDQPPSVLGKKLDDTEYTYNDVMDVSFSESIGDESRCIEIEISDPNTQLEIDDFSEDIIIEAFPLNFDGDISQIIDGSLENKLNINETHKIKLCFEECPLVEEGPFQIGIVAFDDSCPLPLSDTLKITVNLAPPPNQRPYFPNGDLITQNVVEELNGNYTVDITALDDDLENMDMNVFPRGFLLEDYGMSVSTIKDVDGEIISRFIWNYSCNTTTFEDLDEFKIDFIAEDEDKCGFSTGDTLVLDLGILLPFNSTPEITTQDLVSIGNSHYRIEADPGELISFSTFSKDVDNDPINVQGIGANFSFEDFEVQFPTTDGTGDPGIGVDFSWNLACGLWANEDLNLTELDSFRFYLMVEDFDYCQVTVADTMTVDLILNYEENIAPLIEFTSLTEDIEVVSDTSFTSKIFNNIKIEVKGKDTNSNSNLSLELLAGGGNQTAAGFEFSNITGSGEVTSFLTWVPTCENLTPDLGDTQYTFVFRIRDDDCINPLEEIVEFNVILTKVPEPQPEFTPPNVFTPNGDSFNSYFAFEWFDESGEVQSVGIPKDNCVNNFEKIVIINRWGSKVFESDERTFKWFAENEPAGVYYYYLKYTQKDFKGTVTVLN